MKELKQNLFRLYSLCSALINEHRDKGLLTRIPYEHIPLKVVRYSFFNAYYELDFNNIEYYNRYAWSSNSYTEVVQSQVTPAKEFKDCVNGIHKVFKFPVGITANSTVPRFVNHIMQGIIEERITDENAKSIIEFYLKDLESVTNPQTYGWHVTLGLKNMYLEEEEYLVNDYLLIRRPKTQEYEVHRPRSYDIKFIDTLGYPVNIPCVLEFEISSVPAEVGHMLPEKVEKESNTIIDGLLLFLCNDSHLNYSSVTVNSVLHYGIDQPIDSPFESLSNQRKQHAHSSGFGWELKKHMIPKLGLFLSKVRPILRVFDDDSYFDGKPYELAFHRYKDAMLKSTLSADRLLSATYCLEALLPDGKSEMAYKICNRGAIILKHFGYDGWDARKELKSMYEVRSLLAHGSPLKGKHKEFLKNRIYRVLEYTRIILNCFLQLSEKYPKPEQLQVIIDQSLLSTKVQKELTAELKSVVLYRRDFEREELEEYSAHQNV